MIAIVDYGLGNLKSVSKAFQSIGKKVQVTSQKADIESADAVILPGVGAFYRGMENLRNTGLADCIYNVVNKNKPILGICLGMQLFFTESQEHQACKGLDLINGQVKKFSPDVKIPHMGWNQVNLQKSEVRGQRSEDRSQKSEVRRQRQKGLFKGVPENSYFYFVHSYYVVPEEKEASAGVTTYGREFTSVVVKDNIIGVQFHPEKSGIAGVLILKNFVQNFM